MPTLSFGFSAFPVCSPLIKVIQLLLSSNLFQWLLANRAKYLIKLIFLAKLINLLLESIHILPMVKCQFCHISFLVKETVGRNTRFSNIILHGIKLLSWQIVMHAIWRGKTEFRDIELPTSYIPLCCKIEIYYIVIL